MHDSVSPASRVTLFVNRTSLSFFDEELIFLLRQLESTTDFLLGI